MSTPVTITRTSVLQGMHALLLSLIISPLLFFIPARQPYYPKLMTLLTSGCTGAACEGFCARSHFEAPDRPWLDPGCAPSACASCAPERLLRSGVAAAAWLELGTYCSALGQMPLHQAAASGTHLCVHWLFASRQGVFCAHMYPCAPVRAFMNEPELGTMFCAFWRAHLWVSLERGLESLYARETACRRWRLMCMYRHHTLQLHRHSSGSGKDLHSFNLS
jgi:hypothetical protein